MVGNTAMLAELALYATARTSRALRERGLVGDAVALWSRATRRRAAWAPHETRCHAAVRGSVTDLPHCRTAVVLGSGLLRDVPVRELAAAFARVVLVDAVHLLPARLAARRHGCDLLVADLAAPAGLARMLDGVSPIDLVISANLLSQLPISLLREVEDDGAGRRALQAAHLAALEACGARVCLLSDTLYRDVARDGTVLEEVALVDPDLLPPADEAWDWEVAPRGEIARGFARVHRAAVWRDLAAARSATAGRERRDVDGPAAD